MNRIFSSGLLAIILLVSCQNQEAIIENEKESGFIVISEDQFITEKMETGTMKMAPFEETIHCTGKVIALPNGKAEINLPVSGIIKAIHVSSGQMVIKGQKLFDVSGSEFIDLQQEFAKSAATINRLKSEYNRIKALYAEKISAEKEFIAIETDYKTALASYNSLKIKLIDIGTNTTEIENGDLQSYYSATTPISGQISQMNINIGQYPDKGEMVMEIIDVAKLQLSISVFPKDLPRLETGQKVRFTLTDADQEHEARITTIGTAINPDTKAIDCFATTTTTPNRPLINNAFAEIEIITNNKMSMAVPEEALLKTGNQVTILTLEKKEAGKYYFKKATVTTGQHFNRMAEITSAPLNNELLLHGAYNIVIK